MEIKEISIYNRNIINTIMINNWGATEIILRNKIIDGTKSKGFIAEDNNKMVGFLLYDINDDICEIIALYSFVERKGIGSFLLNKIKEIATLKKCDRIVVITTNDNLIALKFYQKRGFFLSKLYCNAFDNIRKIKPNLPKLGENNIPLNDEIELVYKII